MIDVCNSLNDAFVKGDIDEKREILKLVFELPFTVNAKNMVNPEMKGVFKTIYELNLTEKVKKDGANNKITPELFKSLNWLSIHKTITEFINKTRYIETHMNILAEMS